MRFHIDWCNNMPGAHWLTYSITKASCDMLWSAAPCEAYRQCRHSILFGHHKLRWISQCVPIIGRNAITWNKCHFDYRINESSKWTDTKFPIFRRPLTHTHTRTMCTRVWTQIDSQYLASPKSALTNWILTILVWLGGLSLRTAFRSWSHS